MLTYTQSSKRYALLYATLFISALLVLSSLYLTVPLQSVFEQSFQVSEHAAAYAGSSFSLFFALGCLFFGRLSDRLGRKFVLVAGMAALTILTFCIGFTTNFYVFLLFRSLQGFAAATFSPVALTYAGEVFPNHKKVTAIGFISTGFLAAGVFGQIWASFIAASLSWSFVFFLLSVLYLFAVIVMSAVLPEGPRVAVPSSIVPSLEEIRRVIRIRQLFYAYGITIMILLCFVGMYSTLNHYLSGATFGLNANEILAIRSVGLIGMALSPFAGKLEKKLGLLRVLQCGLLMAVFALLMMFVSSHLVVFVGMSLLFVAGIAILVPSLIALIGRLAGEARMLATSLYTFILFLGASLGPVITVYLLGTGSVKLPFLVFAIILLIGFVFSHRIKIKTQ